MCFKAQKTKQWFRFHASHFKTLLVRHLCSALIWLAHDLYCVFSCRCFNVACSHRSSSLAVHRLHDDVRLAHRLHLDPVRRLRGAEWVVTPPLVWSNVLFGFHLWDLDIILIVVPSSLKIREVENKRETSQTSTHEATSQDQTTVMC